MRSHEELREEQAALERRCALLVGDGEETRTALESSERARKVLETELQEACEKFSDLNNQVDHTRSCTPTASCSSHPLNVNLCPVPVGSEWEEEAGGGPADSAAGARGAAGGAESERRQGQEGRL